MQENESGWRYQGNRIESDIMKEEREERGERIRVDRNIKRVEERVIVRREREGYKIEVNRHINWVE